MGLGAQHPAPGICLLGRGDAPVIYLIYSSVAAFRIQTHLDTGDCTDPRALEGGQGRAPGPEQRQRQGNPYQGAVTCHGRLGWAAGSRDYDSNPFFIEKSLLNA